MLPEMSAEGKNERIGDDDGLSKQIQAYTLRSFAVAPMSGAHRRQSVMHSRDRILIRNERDCSENRFVGQTLGAQTFHVAGVHGPRRFCQFSSEIGEVFVQIMSRLHVFPMVDGRMIA